VLFISYTANFSKTFGEDQDTMTPLEPALPALLTALNQDRAWQGDISDGSFPTVSVRKFEDTEEGILLHGHGELTIRQNVLPLNTEISRFGPNPPGDIKRADIAEVRLGSATQADGTLGKALSLTPVQELFAPANFKSMSDDDKLKSPSFTLMNSGVKAVGSDDVSVVYGCNRQVDYELMISDEEPTPEGTVESKPVSLGIVSMPKARFVPFVRGGAIGQSPLSKANVLKRLALDNKRVKTGTEAFAVVFKEILRRCPGTFTQGTRDEADQRLKTLVKDDPSLADKIQMVPEYQAV